MQRRSCHILAARPIASSSSASTKRLPSGWIPAGLAEEQQGGGAELGDNRRAVDVVAGAEPGTVVDRRLDPAIGEGNIDWWPTIAAPGLPPAGSSGSFGGGKAPAASTLSVTSVRPTCPPGRRCRVARAAGERRRLPPLGLGYRPDPQATAQSTRSPGGDIAGSPAARGGALRAARLRRRTRPAL